MSYLLYDRRGGKRLIRLLALFLALAVSTPVLLADDGDHDQDHRDHGQFVDPIVGSWIVHVTIDTFTSVPPPQPSTSLTLQVGQCGRVDGRWHHRQFFPSKFNSQFWPLGKGGTQDLPPKNRSG
jgi:hypothetical protein